VLSLRHPLRVLVMAFAGWVNLIGHILYGSLLGVIASSPEGRVAHA